MTAVQIAIRPALDAVVRLLEAAGLPNEDLTETHLEHFFCAGPRGAPAAVVGVEIFGSQALLRSLAVDSGHRNQGLGSLLVAHVERHARIQGVRRMFLLTTTAQTFFAARGYADVARNTAPAAIRASREFSEICPASSVFMAKKLTP
jgi:amino-acid N-acetyltransferase